MPSIVGEILANRPILASFEYMNTGIKHSTVMIGYDYNDSEDCTDPVINILDPAVSGVRSVKYSELDTYRQNEYSIRSFLYNIQP
jgi:hypothetical protein